MNRADLAWALKAVLPHAAKRPNLVGVDNRDGATYFYATDKYTIGLARLNETVNWRWTMTTKEATALMRFVRPDRVPHRTQDIVYAAQPGELHVGWYDDTDERADESGLVSAVFDLEPREPDYTLDLLLRLFDYIAAAPVEFEQIVWNPDLAERFGQAQREDQDRMRVIPRHVHDKRGAAIVRVGQDFMGAIAGLTYDDVGAELSDFLVRKIDAVNAA